MRQILSALLRSLAVPWVGIVLGLTALYQLAGCAVILPERQFAVACCSVLPLFLLATPVHEFGHAVAARWTNHTVMVISVFGIALHRAHLARPWRFRRTPSPHPANCVVAFADDLSDLRRRHTVLILGGVLMNALVAIFCLGVGQSIFSPFDGVAGFRLGVLGSVAFLAPNTLPIAVLNLFAVANVFAALHALVLSKPGTPLSDGAQLLHLLRGPHVERDVAAAYLLCRLQFAVPPCDQETGQVGWVIAPAEQGTLSSWTSVDAGGTQAERWLLRATGDHDRQALGAPPDAPRPTPD
jgi:hypothetical protein